MVDKYLQATSRMEQALTAAVKFVTLCTSNAWTFSALCVQELTLHVCNVYIYVQLGDFRSRVITASCQPMHCKPYSVHRG